MKKTISVFLTLCSLCGCVTAQEGVSKLPETPDTDSVTSDDRNILEETDAFDNECSITLGSDVKISGEGAWIDNNCVKISESGVYTVEGATSDGMIFVECTDTVKIVLKDAEITNKSGAAIISQSDKLILECASGTVNTLADSKEYSYSRNFEDKDKHESTIYTEGDLYITGGGSISVTGNMSEAVTCGGSLFTGGVSFGINAEDNGIKSGGNITAEGTEITIVCEKDGIKTDGGVTMSDCEMDVKAGNDAVQAEKEFTAVNSVLTVCTYGDITADTELSSKGFKAADMAFTDCIVSAEVTDHALKANGTLDISGGTFSVSSSAGKGFTSEGNMTLSSAEINISAASEGIESKATLTVESGSIDVKAEEDGINTGGDDNSADHSMNIKGGKLVVTSGGDGLDSNGDINISGGTVVVFGPVNDANTAVDCGDFGFKINVTGGKLFALGSSGMMMVPESNYKAVRRLNAAENERVTVTDGNGNIIISIQTPKTAQGLLFSDGTAAEGYKIWLGGTVQNEVVENDIISGGTLSGGTEITADATGFGGGMGFGGRQDGGKKPGMGERPEFPQNGEMPDMGEAPEPPQGEQMPEMGEMPELPQDGEMPVPPELTEAA